MERSCYECKLINVCKGFEGIQDAMKKMDMNIDGSDAPGRTLDVFVSFGRACLSFSPRPTKKQ